MKWYRNYLIHRDISDDEVLNAMRSTSRASVGLVEHNRNLAYSDNPLLIGRGKPFLNHKLWHL